MSDTDFSRYVPNVRFEKIPIKNLVSNQNYQRSLSDQHVLRTAENFDPYQINPVKVSRRNGINYVFNGQHTIEIIAAVSGSRETPVWCMIYYDMDYLQEADTFANQQKYVRQLKPYDIFKANIEAENNKQLTIKALVESYGLKIGPAKGYCVICAISSLEDIFDKYGYHVLDRTLKLCVGTWEGDANSLSAGILKGIALMVVAYQDKLQDTVFEEKLGVIPIKEINRNAKERRPGAMGFAEAMYFIYTRKMKYPPHFSKLQNVKRIAKNRLTAVDSLMDEEDDGIQLSMGMNIGENDSKAVSETDDTEEASDISEEDELVDDSEELESEAEADSDEVEDDFDDDASETDNVTPLGVYEQAGA